MIKLFLKSEKAKKNYEFAKNHIKNVNKAFKLLKPYIADKFSSLQMIKMEKQIKKHDKSKFEPEEFYAYAEYFYGDSKRFQEIFDKAWLHHQHHNPHHHQYWALKEDSGTIKVLDMPKNYVVEMICDWWAFSLTNNNYGAILSWYKDNKDNMQMSNKTRKFTEELLDIIKLNFVKEEDKSL